MGILFISHSSLDNDVARKIQKWLKSQGWDDVFLDIDPERGLVPGHLWQQQLKTEGERCSGVVILVSPNWAASSPCQAEFYTADNSGKKIFPIFIAPTSLGSLPPVLAGRIQIADISMTGSEAERFERLAINLKRSGLDPTSFEWPPPNEPHRSPYRGLQSLDEQDAAIFFGRDALITRGMDTIRRMRGSAPERMLVIFGASGTGKSSFLKAGLIARLKRDEENFLVLPVIRPGRAALTGNQGLAAAVALDPTLLDGPNHLADAIANLRLKATERIRRLADDVHESYPAKPPTVVIALDQAEELFSAENTEAARTIELLAAVVRADAETIVVATIRADAFTKLQEDPRLAEISLLPFSLSPIPVGAFKEVIEGPARLANPPLAIEPAFSDQLLGDLAAKDALPLLAFTLERLAIQHRGGGTLTLADYSEMGGLEGAVTGAVDAAFFEARRDSSLPDSIGEIEKLARATFIPALVYLEDADAEPRRRVERQSVFPESTRALMRHLIDQRLLVSDASTIGGIKVDTVEVAHEAILRQWPALRAWITEEREALRALYAIRAAAARWSRHVVKDDPMRGQNWLDHRGERLQEAEILLSRPDFTSSFGEVELEYLSACRASEDAESAREIQRIARTRRLQRNIGIFISIAAVVVLAAAFGIWQLLAGMAVGASDTLATQAAKESNSSSYDRGARYALASLSQSYWLPSYAVVRAASELRGTMSESSALLVLRGHNDQVLSAAFSPDGRSIVTASRDKTARIWDANGGHEIAVLRGHERQVTSASFSPDGKWVVTASADKTARIWDTKTAAATIVLHGHEDAIVGATFSPDGSLIVTASDDGTARIWNAKSGRVLFVLRGHEGQVESAAFSRDGRRIVTASNDKTARIWDTSTGHEMLVLRGHTNTVEGASFSFDGRRVVTASDDKTARIWDATTGRRIAILSGHDGALNSAIFDSRGSRVVTASRDNTARIWDASTGYEIAVLRGHEDGVNSAAFSSDNRRIVTASDDNSARVWDADIANHVIVLRGHEDAVNSAAFSRDGARIVTGSGDKTARIWNASTGQQIAELRGHEDFVEAVAFSFDGTRVVTASDDKTARIWDANTGHEIAILRGHQDVVYGVAFSPDGVHVVTASPDKTARIWDVTTGLVSMVLRGHSKGLISASFSPDSKRIVTASGDGTARVWDVATGKSLVVLRGHGAGVSSASFSPDGLRIVTAARDKTARIWDATSGREDTILSGHQDVVLSAAFSPDGRWIVTASRDKTARLWDADTGIEVAVLRGHSGAVNSADFGVMGTRVVTSSDDGTARIWNVSRSRSITTDELAHQACATILARGLNDLSAEELRAAPVLDAHLDSDVCHTPGSWTRLGRIFWVGLSH